MVIDYGVNDGSPIVYISNISSFNLLCLLSFILKLNNGNLTIMSNGVLFDVLGS